MALYSQSVLVVEDESLHSFEIRPEDYSVPAMPSSLPPKFRLTCHKKGYSATVDAEAFMRAVQAAWALVKPKSNI